MKKNDTVYKIFKLFKENVIKILIVLREKEKIRWKELQEETKISTATFNRALSALREVHFIKKENGYYKLTWTGKLVTDGLILLGLHISEEMEEVEDEFAEKLLAKDIIMATIMLVLVSIKKRGRIKIDKFEEEMKKEMKIMRNLLKEYEKEGYVEIKNGWVFAKDKMKEFDIKDIFR
ncbi:MAG: winged helix-turn-helix transcriptional regulator [Thermoplasmatales archaeon]|nr:winged helix-turn-helix transcriptional regulator [Thermoplasmatales archaeon]